MPSVHAALVLVFCAQASFARMKVLIRHLRPDICKEDVMRWISRWNMYPDEVYVPFMDLGTQAEIGKCCFVTFKEHQDAHDCCMALDGQADPSMTHTKIKASIIVTQHGIL